MRIIGTKREFVFLAVSDFPAGFPVNFVLDNGPKKGIYIYDDLWPKTASAVCLWRFYTFSPPIANPILHNIHPILPVLFLI